jgi:molybdopterin-containing oxidoreductase family iron-sulfur binding subunit
MGADSFGDFNDKDPMAANGEKGMLSELTRMVLNPDVTVRSRGVMEKCSFCVQRIQEGKLQAKLDRRPMADGDIKTACQTACATGAITFGNLYDNQSEVFQLSENNERAFRVIEEFHTLPSVTYLTKVRNKDAADHVHDVPYEGTLESA